MAARSRNSKVYYVLEQGSPRVEPNLGRWMAWMNQHGKERHVDATRVGNMNVRTEFVGVAAVRSKPGESPKTFQTTVDGGAANGMMRCYADAESARRGHAEVVKLVRKYFGDSQAT